MDISPSDVVEEPDPDPEPTDDHAAAEGTESSGALGSTSTLRDMLMSTEPEEPLERVESPFDPEAGGWNRVARGVRKAFGASGLPAIVDISVGLCEWILDSDFSEQSENDDADSDGLGDGL